MNVQRAASLMLSMLQVVIVTACAAAPSQPPTSSQAVMSPVRGGTISIGVSREPDSLDLHLNIGPVRQYGRALFNTLTRVDLKGVVTGELVESWTLSDPTTYVFKIRQGIKFHDGTSWDAAAMKFNIERVLDPATKSGFRTEFTNVVGVDVVDESTARVRLRTPDVTFPPRMSGKAGTMMSPAAIQKWGVEYGSHVIGTGPFQLDSWIKGDHLTLRRFPEYWEKDAQGGQLPYLDTLIFKPIADATVMFTALRTGQLDLIEGILPSDLGKVQSEPTLTTVSGPGANQVVWLNNSKPPFNNKSLRQAVAWAVDGDAMQRAIYFNTGAPGTFFTAVESWAFDSKGAFYKRDLTKAKAALTAGGQPNGFKFTAVVDNSTVCLQLAQAVKGSLAEAGIDMAIEAVANTTNTARRTSGDFQAAFSFLPPAADPDENLYAYLRTGANVNRGRYSNPQLDEAAPRRGYQSDEHAGAGLRAVIRYLHEGRATQDQTLGEMEKRPWMSQRSPLT